VRDLQPKITAETFRAMAFEGVPYAGQLGCRVERLEADRLTLRMPYQDLLQRPGGTICGPALMALADVTLYGVVLSMIGEAPLAVTTDLTMLTLGRRLAVGEVTMQGEDDARPICHVVGTYAIPPKAGRPVAPGD
jgi:acyl-coenzyme A thioesterase PaaI-like protein